MHTCCATTPDDGHHRCRVNGADRAHTSRHRMPAPKSTTSRPDRHGCRGAAGLTSCWTTRAGESAETSMCAAGQKRQPRQPANGRPTTTTVPRGPAERSDSPVRPADVTPFRHPTCACSACSTQEGRGLRTGRPNKASIRRTHAPDGEAIRTGDNRERFGPVVGYCPTGDCSHRGGLGRTRLTRYACPGASSFQLARPSCKVASAPVGKFECSCEIAASSPSPVSSSARS